MTTKNILLDRINELVKELGYKLEDAELLDTDFSIARELCEQLSDELETIE